MSTPRVALIGLDCGTPELLFDRYRQEMPALSALLDRSAWGAMRSVVPPITVPAWSCMLSGRTPGELGVYGFRNRTDHSYNGLSFATSRAIRVPRLWDRLGATGRESVTLGVPGTYPPSAIAGNQVSCFLTPSTSSTFTHPAELASEIEALTGGYTLDVSDFRSDDKGRIAQQIFDMTEQRFTVARHLATTKPWDFFSFVDMGPDRLHHGFWKYCDPAHPRHDPANPYLTVFRDYYRALDHHLEQFLDVLPDDTTVVVASDHGAQPMVGGFCFNEWLVSEGFLTLSAPVSGPTPIAKAAIDWSHTAAWGDGGYYGRLFLNVEGREPHGTVPPSEYESVRRLLIDKLEGLVDHEGKPMGTRALRPEDVYPVVNGVAPDLIVYFGNLRWRAVGSLGLGTGLYTFENDTGPDDANHAELGMLAMSGPHVAPGELDEVSIYDVAPTLQAIFGLGRLPGQNGKVLL